MDPDRVRAYLQISCAGLGFDIGELWWTSNEDSGSTSALAAIGTCMLYRCCGNRRSLVFFAEEILHVLLSVPSSDALAHRMNFNEDVIG